jgi:SAM-dependent methyltransferase
MALAGDRFYRAATADEVAAARAGKWSLRITPTKHVPQEWLGDVAGKEILCLAGGGARQAPILAAAGAIVTVFDLSQQQLQRDVEVAQRESLSIRTVAGDMRDLSQLESDQFDLIVSPCATCFCPSVDEIWPEAYRVLKVGGRFMIGFINPVYYLFDAAKMDRGELQVRHKIPYSDLDLPDAEREALIGPERPLEFGHSLEQLIGGQLIAGFSLVGFFEDVWGGSDQLSKKISVFVATLAEKR